MQNHWYAEYLKNSNPGHRHGNPEHPGNDLSYVKVMPFDDSDLEGVVASPVVGTGDIIITFPNGRILTWWFHQSEKNDFYWRSGHTHKVHEPSRTLVSYVPWEDRENPGQYKYTLDELYECGVKLTPCQSTC